MLQNERRGVFPFNCVSLDNDNDCGTKRIMGKAWQSRCDSHSSEVFFIPCLWCLKCLLVFMCRSLSLSFSLVFQSASPNIPFKSFFLLRCFRLNPAQQPENVMKRMSLNLVERKRRAMKRNSSPRITQSTVRSETQQLSSFRFFHACASFGFPFSSYKSSHIE